MGWENCHLHQFILGKKFYRHPDSDDDYPGENMMDELEFTLQDLAPKKGAKLKYEYDFGDSWIHLVQVKEIIEDDSKYPECLAGENACPPEDVGGMWGYANMLEALKAPKHPQHETFQEWLGGKFDPKAFDLKEVNRALKRFKY
jgi:hypothetical protein